MLDAASSLVTAVATNSLNNLHKMLLEKTVENIWIKNPNKSDGISKICADF